MRTVLPVLVVLSLALAGCGGMTRAVTTLPRTADDLAAKTEPFRAGRSENERRPAP